MLLLLGLGVGLQFGQNHFPDGASVTRTQCQWYHPTGQVSLSQQIQSLDASGAPQVHLKFASSSGDGGVGGGVSGCGGEGIWTWRLGEAG